MLRRHQRICNNFVRHAQNPFVRMFFRFTFYYLNLLLYLQAYTTIPYEKTFIFTCTIFSLR